MALLSLRSHYHHHNLVPEIRSNGHAFKVCTNLLLSCFNSLFRLGQLFAHAAIVLPLSDLSANVRFRKRSTCQSWEEEASQSCCEDDIRGCGAVLPLSLILAAGITIVANVSLIGSSSLPVGLYDPPLCFQTQQQRSSLVPRRDAQAVTVFSVFERHNYPAASGRGSMLWRAQSIISDP